MGGFTEETYRQLNGAARYQYAFRARAAAAKAGVAPAGWALRLKDSHEAAASVVPECVAAVAAIASSGALPCELAAWRAEAGGVVQVNARGVVLYRWQDGVRLEARFTATAEAIAALACDGVRWAPQKDLRA